MTTVVPRRILFTTFDGGGNVAPIMVVVAKLVERGHDVRVMSDRTSRDEVDAAGGRFVSWTRAPSRSYRDRDQDPQDWAAATPEQALHELVRHFICGQALAYAEDVGEELRREPADLVINFDLLLGVSAGCEAHGQRFALLSTMVSMFPITGVPPFGAGLMPPQDEGERAAQAQVAVAAQQVYDTGLPAFNQVRAGLGLKPLAHLLDQADAAEVRWLGTARAFDFAPDFLPASVRYAGPLVRDPVWASGWTVPWPIDDSRPLVVVGFSTSFQNHAACVQRVIDACAQLPVRALVTLGGSLHVQELRAAPNTCVVDRAPHNEVMRDAALVITHGGHGTVMTALVHKVPLLMIPHGRDQPDNAARITHRGAGLALAPAAEIDELRAAIRRLLAEPSFHRNAHLLGEAVAQEIRNSSLIEEIEGVAGAAAVRLNADAESSPDPDLNASSCARRKSRKSA